MSKSRLYDGVGISDSNSSVGPLSDDGNWMGQYRRAEQRRVRGEGVDYRTQYIHKTGAYE